MRVAIRLALANLLLAAIMLATAVFTITYSTAAYQERVAKDALLLAERVATYIRSNTQFFREDMDLFLITSRMGDRLSGETDEAELSQLLRERFLAYFIEEYGFKVYEEVVIADVHGRVRGSTCGAEHGNLLAESWWREAVSKGYAFTDVAYQPEVNLYGTIVGRGHQGKRWRGGRGHQGHHPFGVPGARFGHPFLAGSIHGDRTDGQPGAIALCLPAFPVRRGHRG